MADLVPLDDIPLIDNHCHPLETRQRTDIPSWRGYFSESFDPGMQSVEAADTAFYHRLLRAMAAFHQVSDDEAEILAARAGHSPAALAGALFRDAAVAGVVIDTGYPDPAGVMPAEEFVAATGVAYRSLLRVEVLFQRLIAEQTTYSGLVDAARAGLTDVRAAGFAGLKTVVGYRTGLDIRRWEPDAAQDGFRLARQDLDRDGTLRLAHQPLLDTLLHLTLVEATRQELPVQFHVGYGDPDVDFRTAGPLQLQSVIRDPAYRGLPIVLLHGCWPYFREGAYLASVHPHVYLDVSYTVPLLSVAELTSVTRAAVGTAPFSRIMYSSDAARVPEGHWHGAQVGRRALSRVLGELVADDELTPDTALDAGRRILYDNAAALYGFGPT